MPDRRPPARARRARPRPADPRGPAAIEGDHTIASGTASFVSDGADSDGWLVFVNGVPSSYVHLGDPTRLEFEYVRWIGDVLDTLDPPPPEPRSVAHLGGAGCTLARYVATTRPRSRQVVFEHDSELVTLAREAFDLRRSRGIRLRHADARDGLATLTGGSYDVVIRDAFDGNQVPAHLTTVEYAHEVARVLTAGGVYVANVADRTEQRHARAEAATLRTAFRHVAMVAEPSQLRGRRYGNVLLIASRRPLPITDLTRRLGSGAVRARVVPPRRVGEFVADVRPFHDHEGSQSYSDGHPS